MSILVQIKEYQIILSSAVAIGSAFFVTWKNRQTSAMTNAVNIVKEMSKDDKLLEGIKIINTWDQNGDDSIDCLASTKCKEHLLIKKAKVNYVLNQYEHLAVGIKNKIYSEAIIKQNSYGTIVNLVGVARPLILRVRSISKRSTIWEEIEMLAQKWEQDPLKPKKK